MEIINVVVGEDEDLMRYFESEVNSDKPGSEKTLLITPDLLPKWISPFIGNKDD